MFNGAEVVFEDLRGAITRFGNALDWCFIAIFDTM